VTVLARTVIVAVLVRIRHNLGMKLTKPLPARSVRVAVALPPEVATLLRTEAARQGRSTSSLAGFLLENAIRQVSA
jgi:hypothetical protein